MNGRTCSITQANASRSPRWARVMRSRTSASGKNGVSDVITSGRTLGRSEQSNVRYPRGGDKSGEGRSMPMLVLSDPPVQKPEDAAKKLVVLLFANIHAGEVDGKEAVLMLARDIATAADKDLLKELVVLIVPILNADGNEP